MPTQVRGRQDCCCEDGSEPTSGIFSAFASKIYHELGNSFFFESIVSTVSRRPCVRTLIAEFGPNHDISAKQRGFIGNSVGEGLTQDGRRLCPPPNKDGKHSKTALDVTRIAAGVGDDPQGSKLPIFGESRFSDFQNEFYID